MKAKDKAEAKAEAEDKGGKAERRNGRRQIMLQ